MSSLSHSRSPLVSAIIPTYGRPEYLTEAIQSICDQTYDPVELVVVDDGSPDPVEPRLADVDTSALADARFVRHEVNRGASAARNTGIREASGDFLAFLDDDDYWLPNHVQRQVDCFQAASPSTGVVYTGLKFVDGEGSVLGNSNRTLAGDITEDLLRGASIGSFTRLMVRAPLVDSAGYLDETLPSWQDRDWNLRLSRVCAFEPLPEPLAVHRRGSHDQIGDNYKRMRDVTLPHFVEKHRPLAASYGCETERRFLAVHMFRLAAAALDQGYNREALGHIRRAIGHDPKFTKSYVYLPFTIDANAYRRTKRLKQMLRGTLSRVPITGRVADHDY